MTHKLVVYTVEVSDKTTWIWFRVEDGNGLSGIGEATLNSRAEDVLAALPRVCEAVTSCGFGLAAKMAAVRSSVPGVVGRSIASAIEQCWLDLEGQRTGRPINALLGGCYRASIPCYANINRGTLSRCPEEFASRAEMAIKDGYKAIKMAPFDGVTPDARDEEKREGLIEAGVERIAATIRQLDGSGNVQVDCHSRFRCSEAGGLLERLAGLGVSWFEEPILETDAALATIGELREQAKQLDVILAGAEQASGLAEFEPYCHARCYEVIMPDIILAGGPSEVVRIGYLGAAMEQAISLHNPSGPVMDMHSMHVAASVPKLHSLERQFRESPLYDELVDRVHRFKNGNYELDDAPGLGLTVDWDSDVVNERFSAAIMLSPKPQM